jgi:hypothetical protein
LSIIENSVTRNYFDDALQSLHEKKFITPTVPKIWHGIRYTPPVAVGFGFPWRTPKGAADRSSITRMRRPLFCFLLR